MLIYVSTYISTNTYTYILKMRLLKESCWLSCLSLYFLQKRPTIEAEERPVDQKRPVDQITGALTNSTKLSKPNETCRSDNWCSS